MNEPQVWVLIGVFAASMVGVITLVLRTMNVQFEAMHARIDALRGELKAGIDSVRTEVSAVRTELQADIGSLRTQITHLDRDVQAISKRVFPE